MNLYTPTYPYMCTQIPKFKPKLCDKCECCGFDDIKDGKQLIFVTNGKISLKGTICFTDDIPTCSGRNIVSGPYVVYNKEGDFINIDLNYDSVSSFCVRNTSGNINGCLAFYKSI